MKTNKKLIIPIKEILVITIISIILGTNIFIYNLAKIQNIEITNIANIENNKTKQEQLIIKTAQTENKNIIQREVTAETARSSMNNRKQTADTKVKQESVKEDIHQYTQIKDVKISKTMDLTVRTNLSKEDFKTLISNVKQDTSKFFYNNSDLIYDLCEKYEINEIFFCGLISAESGWNIASNHRRTYNYISLMSKGNLIKYNSVEQGLEVAAQKLHNNYLTKGGAFYYGKTLSAVKTKFCPASSTWTDLVYGRMKQMI